MALWKETMRNTDLNILLATKSSNNIFKSTGLSLMKMLWDLPRQLDSWCPSYCNLESCMSAAFFTRENVSRLCFSTLFARTLRVHHVLADDFSSCLIFGRKMFL